MKFRLKALLTLALAVGLAASGFSQSAEYTKYLNLAKKYEAEKKWCHALGAYYDAMATDDKPESKEEAYTGYVELSRLIEGGNPGKGSFNEFTIYDAWKNLLIETKKYDDTIWKYSRKIGNLERVGVNYEEKTGTYKADIKKILSGKYFHTVFVVMSGYERTEKWYGLRDYYSYSRYDPNVDYYIVDESGNKLVAGNPESNEIYFYNVPLKFMEVIDNGGAFVLPMSRNKRIKDAVFWGRGCKGDIKGDSVSSVFLSCFKMVKIPNKKYSVGETEVTQMLYGEVMKENPSNIGGVNLPVENVSWYDAIYFCNKLSMKKGLSPVYAVDGETDVAKWNYTPHKEEKLHGEITQNVSASGFRLPTVEEWQYAARGGQDYTYSGSNNLDEVGWYDDNSGDRSHPVAQKRPNGYGLYDMSGNVLEWCWDSDDNSSAYFGLSCRYNCGGSWDFHGINGINCKVSSLAYNQSSNVGFRIVCNASN